MASKIKKSTTKKIQKSTGLKKSGSSATSKKNTPSKSVKKTATKNITAPKTEKKTSQNKKVTKTVKKVVKKQITPDLPVVSATTSSVQEETTPQYSDFKPVSKKEPKNKIFRTILSVLILIAFIFTFRIITSKVKRPEIRPTLKEKDLKKDETSKSTNETTEKKDEKTNQDTKKNEMVNSQTTEKKTIVTKTEKTVEKKNETKIEKKQTEPLTGEYYITEKGDTLIAISRKVYGSWKHWKEIYELNKKIIKNPTIIFPRHRLKLPEGLKRIDK